MLYEGERVIVFPWREKKMNTVKAQGEIITETEITGSEIFTLGKGDMFVPTPRKERNLN